MLERHTGLQARKAEMLIKSDLKGFFFAQISQGVHLTSLKSLSSQNVLQQAELVKLDAMILRSEHS
jgi:hypothetical protein